MRGVDLTWSPGLPAVCVTGGIVILTLVEVSDPTNLRSEISDLISVAFGRFQYFRYLSVIINTPNLVVQVEHSVGCMSLCVCVRTITIERKDI